MNTFRARLLAGAQPLLWTLAIIAVVWHGELLWCLAGLRFGLAECTGEGAVAFSRMVKWAVLVGGGLSLLAWLLALIFPRHVGPTRGLRWLVPLALGGPMLPLVTSLWPTAENASGRPDVFLIVVDTERFDAVDPERTPAVWSLVRDGLWFPEAWSTASWTRAAFASILTGLYPYRHGAGFDGHAGSFRHALRDDVPTVAEALSGAGYQTASFTTNNLLGRNSGLDRGFEHYRNILPDSRAFALSLDPGEGPYVPAEVQEARLAQWLRFGVDPDRPVFAMLQFMDPHQPFNAKGVDLRSEHAAHPGSSAARESYGAEVRRVDRSLARLLAVLRESGRYDGALIVYTSDHGEEIDEQRSVVRHTGLPAHGHSLYPELVHVPLAVKLPGNAGAGSRCEGLATTMDIAPTVLRVAGIEAVDTAPTASLVGPAGTCGAPRERIFPGTTLYAPQDAMLLGTRGVIWNQDGGEWQAWDRAEDPAFLAPAESPTGAERKELEAWVGEITGESARGKEHDLSVQELKALEALGYVE